MNGNISTPHPFIPQQASCDKYDTGISIISIRVTKPKIPANILKEFEGVETQKAHLLVLQQEQNAAKKVRGGGKGGKGGEGGREGRGDWCNSTKTHQNA